MVLIKWLVYVCEGGDCFEKGFIELYVEFKCRFVECDFDKFNRVRKYLCFGGCEYGINVVLFFDWVFYSNVIEIEIDEIVEYFIGDGEVVK